MKVSNTEQPSVQQVDNRNTKAQAAGKKNAAAKPQAKDRVEFTKPLDAELQAREAEQAKRVETIKAQLQAGKYQVSSREVAQKMLSRKSGGEDEPE